MAKYHVNPETGNPNVCRAKLSCPYGGDEKHFEGNKNEARKWAEEVNAENYSNLSTFPTSSSAKEPETIAQRTINSALPELVKNYRNLDDGLFFKDKHGNLYVSCENRNYNMHDNYPMGDLTKDEQFFQKLHELDEFKDYQEGFCKDLAVELLNRHDDIVAVDEIRTESGEAWHYVAKHKDGYYVDSLGLWSEDRLEEYWNAIGEREGEDLELHWQEDLEEKDKDYEQLTGKWDGYESRIGDALIPFLEEKKQDKVSRHQTANEQPAQSRGRKKATPKRILNTPDHMKIKGSELPRSAFIGGKELDPNNIRHISNDGPIGKPSGGLWLSPVNDDTGNTEWEDWSRREDFNTDNLKVRSEITLDDSTDILKLDNDADFSALPDDYITASNTFDWEKIAEDYDGVTLTEEGNRANYQRMHARGGMIASSTLEFSGFYSDQGSSIDANKHNRHIGPWDLPSTVLFPSASEKINIVSAENINS